MGISSIPSGSNANTSNSCRNYPIMKLNSPTHDHAAGTTNYRMVIEMSGHFLFPIPYGILQRLRLLIKNLSAIFC
ncbi:hypothetical protein SAMN05421803_14218 [Nocardiopsis flavescens]|uniref:Uncharacterized protein n=1 Tax=Nocardiopsis flavescens TaxID=758803 RepID=A0A1M6WCT3_9ACTN|nr:hypothetical protein SAMN05421803_14218 [Nocardiopsis flavescens]